jgi:hypothetical protein
VIHLDTSLSQQLLDIAIGQAVAQVPAHPHRDHLTGEPIASRSREARRRTDHRISFRHVSEISHRNTAGDPADEIFAAANDIASDLIAIGRPQSDVSVPR